VLIVTREPLLAELLTDALGSGYTCLTQASTTSAFARFSQEPPALTVVDLGSLGQQGLDLIVDIRLTDANAACVAIVARSASLEATVYSLGVTDIVRRDDDLRQILTVLEGARAADPDAPVFDEPVTVLVADDDESVRRLLERVLSRQGYRVLMASDGAQALQVLDQERVHLLFLDLQMPRVGGLAVLRWIQHRTNAPRVVIVSASTDRDLKVETIQLGAFDYLEKPVSVDRLLVTASAAMVLAPDRSRSVWKTWVKRSR
jgi:DNA-binding response OmpR family regulator